MAENPIPEILPDLPENWGYGQIVAPDGKSVGLSEQHGYNYLMQKVNAAVRAINEIIVEMGQLVPEDMVKAKGGAELILPAALGVGPYIIEFTEEAAGDFALKSDLKKYALITDLSKYALITDLSEYAKLLNPKFTRNIVVGHLAIGLPGVGESFEFEDTSYGCIVAGYNNTINSNARELLCIGTGNRCTSGCVTLGMHCEAGNAQATAIGYGTKALSNYSVSSGFKTQAGYLELAHGKFNVVSTESTMYSGNLFVLGNGENEDARSNAFRVSKSGGTFGVGSFNSSGADYAEIYEWLDGNPEAEDRVGRFVVLDGERICLASPEDNVLDILGIVSATPSVVGDSHDDQWRDMYLRDIFGRLVYEDVEVEDPATPGEMHMERRRKLNPNYDPSQTYIPQSNRPEKSAVGLLGKLVVIDDGTCEVNGWCTAGDGGIAVKSETRTRFRVMSRLDETHIRVNIMVQ